MWVGSLFFIFCKTHWLKKIFVYDSPGYLLTFLRMLFHTGWELPFALIAKNEKVLPPNYFKIQQIFYSIVLACMNIIFLYFCNLNDNSRVKCKRNKTLPLLPIAMSVCILMCALVNRTCRTAWTEKAAACRTWSPKSKLPRSAWRRWTSSAPNWRGWSTMSSRSAKRNPRWSERHTWWTNDYIESEKCEENIICWTILSCPWLTVKLSIGFYSRPHSS